MAYKDSYWKYYIVLDTYLAGVLFFQRNVAKE
jgi:hypothetical protein